MQTQDNTETCYRRGNQRIRQKTFPRPSKSKLIHQRIKLEYMNNKRSSKPSLPHVLEPSKFLLPTDFLEPYLLQLFGSHNLAQLHLPMNGSFQCFPAAPKFHFYTQYECSKCLDQQHLKDVEMVRQELRKTTRKCVNDCGYKLGKVSYARIVYLRIPNPNFFCWEQYDLWILQIVMGGNGS